MPSAKAYRKEPLKSIYLLWEAINTTFVRAPLWVIFALPPSKRPRPSWSLERVVRVNWLKLRPYIVAKAGEWTKEPNYLAIEDGPGIKAVWIAPTPHLIVGEVKQWAETAGVDAVRIPGYWLDKSGTNTPVGAVPKPGEKVILSFHGGGYARLSGHPHHEPAQIPYGILAHAGANVVRALSVEYRLTKHPSKKPSNPFPAALLDAVAAYSCIVNEVGFAPEDIIVEGDSAGGGLALALTRYLVENQGVAILPRPPSALVLICPWVDLGPASSDPNSSAQANIHCDQLNIANRGTKIVCANYFEPALGPSGGTTNRYISPASTAPEMGRVSFVGFPPAFVVAGGAEVMLDQLRVLRDVMRRDMGTENVEYLEHPDAIHDYPQYLWHEPERTECLRAIAQWIEARTDDTKNMYFVPKARL